MPGTKGRACLGEAAAHLACDPGVASDVSSTLTDPTLRRTGSRVLVRLDWPLSSGRPIAVMDAMNGAPGRTEQVATNKKWDWLTLKRVSSKQRFLVPVRSFEGEDPAGQTQSDASESGT